ncbi:MAG: bifunctional oligoribonuclease/PAP phosphatase NrnA [Bacteroidetes bacterium]|nr:MAG: bifunctional oligoribonuclease/PAP phosphatase NrnA [Bacteroidota bacterium]
MQAISRLKELLRTPKKIVITTHQKPDADALGSSLALWGYLKKYGHQVQVITPTDYPDFLAWMNGNDHVIQYDQSQKSMEISNKIIAEAEVIFCLDFSDLKRIEPMDKPIRYAKATKVLLDHHQGNTKFADIEFWDVKASATAELVYDLIIDMGDKHLLDIPIAEAIYAGVLTDTGSFKFPSTSPKVHMVIADLMTIGIKAAQVHRNIYDNNSVDRLKFLGFALQEKLIVKPEYKTAYFAITSQELRSFNHKTGDTEGIVNYALSLKDICFAAIMMEKPDCIRISFRSFGNFSVNEFANKHFNGGGHRNAAGGKSMLSLAETVAQFERLLPIYQNILLEA